MEFQVGVHHLFIDFKVAYNSINRSQLYVAMKELGIPNKIIRMIKMTMAQVQCSVRIQSHLSDSFKTIGGLRQSDALACLPFNIALEKRIQDSGIQTRGIIFFKTTQLLAYADDRYYVMNTGQTKRHIFLSHGISTKNGS
jgi:sorting nexin-29